MWAERALTTETQAQCNRHGSLVFDCSTCTRACTTAMGRNLHYKKHSRFTHSKWYAMHYLYLSCLIIIKTKSIVVVLRYNMNYVLYLYYNLKLLSKGLYSHV